MLKRILFAVMPLAMVASTVEADDIDDLNIDVSSITDADVEIVEASLDVDVDRLASEAAEDNMDEAIEACFRRFRGHYRNWHFGHRAWHCYRPYYRPCYRAFHCVRPIYHIAHVCTPIYNCYWGCY